MDKFLTRTVEPASEPVTTADALAFLRAETDDTTLVAGLVTVAREFVENFTGRALMPQTWKLTSNAWNEFTYSSDDPCFSTNYNAHKAREIRLERTPLSSVTSVTYWPAVGSVRVVLSSSLYTVQTGIEPGRIVLNADEEWPDLADRPDAIEIVFVAGYANAAAVPASLKHAMQLMVGNFYEQRTPIIVGTIASELPMSARHILESYRVGGWSA